MDTRADPAASAEGELVALGAVWVGGGFAQSLEVVHVALRVKGAGVGMAFFVMVDAPDVVNDSSTLWDEVTHVLVVLGNGVGNGAHDGGWHPTKGLLHDGTDVLEVKFVFHGGHTVGSDDAVNFLLGLLLDLGVQEHGLDKSVKSAGGGIGAGFQESSGNIGGLVVAEAFFLLGLSHANAEARGNSSVRDRLLGLEPMTDIEFLLTLVELPSALPGGQEEIGEVSEEREEVDEGSSTGLVDFGELRESVEELLHLLVLVRRRTPTEDHRCRQSVGVSSDVMQEVFWLRQKLIEHLLVLKHLVGNVGLGRSDVEKPVDHLPELVTGLMLYSTNIKNEKQRLTLRHLGLYSIIKSLRPPLHSSWPIYISCLWE